ncbi:MAG: cytochrome P450 [Candidatus Acidiferrales bacterium]
MTPPPATPAPKILFTPEFVQDPYPTYRRLLDEGPLHYVDVSGGTWAVWGVFSHADCLAATRDARLSAKRMSRLLFTLTEEEQAEFKELGRMLEMWMIFMDAPEHTRLRKLMNKGFSPAAVEGLRTQVEAVVDRMLEPLKPGGQTDLMRAVAYPMPVRVIAGMLGVAEELHANFIEWSESVATFIGTPDRTAAHARAAQNAIVALTNCFRQSVAERRRNKGADLISLLIDIEADGEVLTEEELYAQCVGMLFAGHETTRNLIGNGIYALLRHADEMRELRENPEMIRTAVEELLRFESPIQYTARTVKEEAEICGVRLRRGQVLLCMLGAANRDARQFKDPDRLNLKRVNNQHVAFGAGAHFCIGNQLARLEGQTAILRMVQRYPKMRLAAQPEWAPNFGFRGLKSLLVEL